MKSGVKENCFHGCLKDYLSSTAAWRENTLRGQNLFSCSAGAGEHLSSQLLTTEAMATIGMLVLVLSGT